jgi:hypothetical protein
MYKIIANGQIHGEYSNLEHANNALKSMNVPREKNSFPWQLTKDGQCLKSGQTPLKKNSFSKQKDKKKS